MLGGMDDVLLSFLTRAGWATATTQPLTSDWSPRKYWRLTHNNGRRAILLQGPATPVAGHSLDDFIRLGAHLRGLGLSGPEIYAPGLPHQLLVIEDFGSTPIDMPSVETHGYGSAIDVLSVFRRAEALHTEIPDYKDGYIYKRLGLFATQLLGCDEAEWLEAWDAAERALPPCPYVFSHMDYKAGNLHWLPERDGIRRIGLLDYQAAQNAPFTYDIVNLLEDARRDIDAGLKTILITRFEEALPEAWKSIFVDWYALVAAQFHARVLGQIIDKPHVAPDVIPRLRVYLRAEMDHPALAPVRPYIANALDQD